MQNMLDGTNMDCENYDKTLTGWSNNPFTPNGRTLGASGRLYWQSQAARNNLVNVKGWTITGDTYGNCNFPLETWYLDADNDGHYVTSQLSYGSPGEGYNKTATQSGDCDDNDNTVYPGAPEICDGKDNDCNGETDEGVKTTFYLDADNDGFGDAAQTTEACTQPSGYISNSTDCDDNDNTVYPGAPEICDGKDNDCNGETDEGVKTTFYLDADNDGFGDAAQTTEACAAPSGYVSNNTDCNDDDATVHELQQYYVDADHDGFGSTTTAMLCSSAAPLGYSTNNTDCNDNAYTVYPGAPEVCGNGIDDNCNIVIDENCSTNCENATGLTTTNITATSAQLNWSASANPVQWQVEYKTTNTGSKWIKVQFSGSARSLTISSLTAKQKYLWRIRAKCGKKCTKYSDAVQFKTGCNTSSVSKSIASKTEPFKSAIRLYPNPSSGRFVIELHIAEKINADAKIQLLDMTGKTVYTENAVMNNGSLQKNVTISSALANGVYMVRIIVNGNIYKAQLLYAK